MIFFNYKHNLNFYIIIVNFTNITINLSKKYQITEKLLYFNIIKSLKILKNMIKYK